MKRLSLWLIAFLCLSLLGALLLPQQTDSNFVIYRFAATLIMPDSATITYLLVPLLLALSGNILTASIILIVITRALCGLLLARITGNRWEAGLAFVAIMLAWPSPVILTMLTLALGGVNTAQHSRWRWSGLLIGLAILTDPAAMILALLLMILALRDRALRRYLPFVILSLGGLLLLTIGTHTEMITVTGSTISVALPALAIFVLIRRFELLKESPYVAALAAWSAISGAIALLHGTETAVIFPGAIALISLLASFPPHKWRKRGVMLIAAVADLILIIAIGAPTLSSAQVGEWIRAHTGSADVVATTQIGALSYYTQRPIVDTNANSLDKDFFVRYAPTVVVLEAQTAAWQFFKTTYTQVYTADGETVYQRVVNFTPLIDHPVNIVLNGNLLRDDLALSDCAIADVIHPGDLLRVRLDWSLAAVPAYDMEIRLLLLDAQGKLVANTTDTIAPEQWQLGVNSTYHLIAMPGNISNGALTVKVGVSIRDGDLGTQQVATINVVK